MIKHNVNRVKREQRKYRRKEIRRIANERIKKRLTKPIPRSVVPSFFTLMNLLSGFMAIIQVYQGYLVYAAWLIVLAAFFDVLDGFMARLTNGSSEFGMELDSLSDVVSFGIAPGFLIYAWLFADSTGLGLPLVAALPALCGAVRLARFNVEAREDSPGFFRGLPIPAQAMMLVSFFLTFYERIEMFDVFKQGINVVIIPVIVILSILMVSTVPFDKIPRFKKGEMRAQRGKIFLFIGYGLTIIFLQEYGLMIVFTVFIIRAIFMSGLRFWREVMSDVESSSGQV